MKGIILASHGKLAEGLLDTLKIFAGEPENIEAICLMPGDDMAEFLTKMKNSIENVDTGEGVVVFCDLLFGTPCNCSGAIFKQEGAIDNIQVITGMNLPMVLEYIGSRSNGMSASDIILTGQNGIVDFNKLFKERQS